MQRSSLLRYVAEAVGRADRETICVPGVPRNGAVVAAPSTQGLHELVCHSRHRSGRPPRTWPRHSTRGRRPRDVESHVTLVPIERGVDCRAGWTRGIDREDRARRRDVLEPVGHGRDDERMRPICKGVGCPGRRAGQERGTIEGAPEVDAVVSEVKVMVTIGTPVVPIGVDVMAVSGQDRSREPPRHRR